MFPIHRAEAHNMVPPGWRSRMDSNPGLQLLGNIEYLRICTLCSVSWNFVRNLNLVKTLHLDLYSLLKEEEKETQNSHTEGPSSRVGPGERLHIHHKQPCGDSLGPWPQDHFCPIVSGSRFWSHINVKFTNTLGHQGRKTRGDTDLGGKLPDLVPSVMEEVREGTTWTHVMHLWCTAKPTAALSWRKTGKLWWGKVETLICHYAL